MGMEVTDQRDQFLKEAKRMQENLINKEVKRNREEIN